MLLFVLVRGRHMHARFRWSWLAVPPFLLGLAPIVLWNAQHDWVSVRHLLGHLGLPGGDAPVRTADVASWQYNPLWTLEYIGYQFAIAGPALALIGLGIYNLLRARRDGRAGWRAAGPAYMLCCAMPVLVLYLLVTAITSVEANWTIVAYVTLACIGGWAAVDGLARRDQPMIGLYRASYITLIVMSTGFFALGVERAAYWGQASEEHDTDSVQGLIPLGRLRGIDLLASEAAASLAQIERETGLPPFVMSIHYGRAAQLAFYLPGQPTVYGTSAFFGDGRKTQYDLWAKTNLADPAVNEPLLGRPALLFHASIEEWERFFDRVEPIGKLPHEPKSDREAFIGYGFRGMSKMTTDSTASGIDSGAGRSGEAP